MKHDNTITNCELDGWLEGREQRYKNLVVLHVAFVNLIKDIFIHAVRLEMSIVNYNLLFE